MTGVHDMLNLFFISQFILWSTKKFPTPCLKCASFWPKAPVSYLVMVMSSSGITRCNDSWLASWFLLDQSMTKTCVMTFGDICIFICWHLEFLSTASGVPKFLVEHSGFSSSCSCSVNLTGKTSYILTLSRCLGRERGEVSRAEMQGVGAQSETASDSLWQWLWSGWKSCSVLMRRRVTYTPQRETDGQRERKKRREIHVP